MEKEHGKGKSEKLRLFLDFADDYSICMLDANGKIMSCNADTEKVKGYTSEEVIDKHYSMFYTEEDVLLKRPEQALKTAVEKGVFQDEGWRVRKDRSLVWASVIITPMYDRKQSLTGFSKITRNLTERKKAAQALIESEERYRLLVNGVKDYAVYMLDTEGYIVSWNYGAERLKGYKGSEITGKHFSIFYSEEDQKNGMPEKLLETVKVRGSFEGEGWRVRKDGTKFWANIVITAIANDEGEHIGFSKITRNLTERREAEQMYRLLVEAVKDYAIFMLDTKGNILTWNEGAQRLKGYKPHEIIGKHFSVFYPEKDKEAGKPVELLQAALNNERVEDEGWRVKKDGTTFWADVVITAVYNDDGKHIGFSKVTRDLTERMKTEQALKEALERKDEFISIASHELKTPLTSAKAFMQLTDRELSADSRNTVGKYVQKSIEYIERLNKLVADLLDVSKIQAGKLQYNIEAFDIRTIVNNAVESVRHGTKSHKIIIENKLDSPVTVEGDKERIEQVFVNLLTNAIKYSPKADKVLVSVTREGNNAIVAIKDYGIGIPKEQQDKIFDRFFRSNELAPHFTGLGIGLYISCQIIKRHEGRIRVESTEGKGSTFYASIPIQQEAG